MNSQKGFSSILLLVIFIGVFVFSAFYFFIKHLSESYYTPTGVVVPLKHPKVFNFNGFSITLPQDYRLSELDKGQITDGNCYFGAEKISGALSCPVAIIYNVEDNSKLLISNAPLVGGGGGFINTVSKEEVIGPPGQEAPFNITWEGEVDSQSSEPTGRPRSENGEPVLYFISGCLKDGLCLLKNADQNKKDTEEFEQFKKFTNSLFIIESY